MPKMIWVFLLALTLRLIFIAANHALGLEPVWFDAVLASLTAAEIKMGVPITYPQAVEFAWREFVYDHKGTAFLHMGLIALTGTSSFLKLTVIQAFLDSSAVFLIKSLARRWWDGRGDESGGENFAVFCALGYSVYPLAIFMCAVPIWYTYLNFGTLALTWVATQIFFKKTNYIYIKLLMALLVAVGVAQARISITLPAFVLGASCLLLHLREKSLTKFVIAGSLGLMAIAPLSFLVYQKINFLASEGLSTKRVAQAHSFLMGACEMQNSFCKKYELDGSDEALVRSYQKQTGDNYRGVNVFDYAPYTRWTHELVSEFLKDHPVDYLKALLRRQALMVFPKFNLSLIADVDAFEGLRKKNQPTSLSDSGAISSTGLDAIRVGNLLLKIMVMFGLPLGVLLALFYSARTQRPLLFLYASPLISYMVFLALIRKPNYDHASAWSVLFVVAMYGFHSLFQHLRGPKRLPEGAPS